MNFILSLLASKLWRVGLIAVIGLPALYFAYTWTWKRGFDYADKQRVAQVEALVKTHQAETAMLLDQNAAALAEQRVKLEREAAATRSAETRRVKAEADARLKAERDRQKGIQNAPLLSAPANGGLKPAPLGRPPVPPVGSGWLREPAPEPDDPAVDPAFCADC